MQDAFTALSILLPTLYALVWADYALLFFRNDPFAERSAPVLLRVTVTLHFLTMLLRGLAQKSFPIGTVFEAFSLLALTVIVLYLLIESKIGVRTTGFFLVGIVFLFELTSSVFIGPPGATAAGTLGSEPAFVLHVSTALLACAGMAVSAVYGLLYLMLFHDIKQHRFGLIYQQLPSLEVMSSFTYRSATMGLILLTVAMLAGVALLVQVSGDHWWDPKLMITFVAWLIYGVCVAARRWWGWSARRVALTSLTGFAVIMFSLMVVNFLFTSFHGFV